MAEIPVDNSKKFSDNLNNFFLLFSSISSLIESELIARLRRGLEEVIAKGDDGY